MKKFILILFLVVYSNKNYGQTIQDSIGNKVFLKVDVEASYPGGDIAWRQYLQKNLNPNTLYNNKAPDGTYTVKIKFIVRKDGNIDSIYCENNPGYGVCEEGVRVIKMSSKWVPAKLNGDNVAAYRRQPITLRIKN